MSDDQPENILPAVAPVLRREALLPNERSRWLGTVAVVCTMAGVASGLALATTLMAMQVADSMSSRACPYREAQVVPQVDVRPDHGFLGIRYVFHHGFADIDSVVPGTPAEAIDLHPGDHVLSINNTPIGSASEQERPRAMSLVTWTPPTGTLSVKTTLPETTCCRRLASPSAS